MAWARRALLVAARAAMPWGRRPLGGVGAVAWARRALLVATLAVVAHQALVPMDETDLFFHLKIGDEILAHGSIPFVNRFSFTFPDHPDPDLAWGFQVLFAALFRLGGFPAVVLAKALLVLLAFSLITVAARRAGAGPVAVALAVLVALWAATPRLVERPHLVTFVGLGALRLWLEPALRSRARACTRQAVILLLVVVWANFHAGVFFAPLVIGLFAVGRWLEARLTRALPEAPTIRDAPAGAQGERPPSATPSTTPGERPPTSQGAAPATTGPATRQVFLLAVLAAGAALLSPGGLRLPRYLAWHTGLGSTRIVEEFRVADLANDQWFFVMVVAVLLTLLMLGRRAPWRWALPVVALVPLAWRSVRFIAEWAILAAPLVAVGLTHLGQVVAKGLTRVGGTVGALLRRLTPGRPLVQAPPWAGIVALLVLASGLLGGVAWDRRGRWHLPGMEETLVPLPAIRFATQHGLRERMFHNLDVGCYLLWQGWPRYRVFQDARLPAYPDDFHRALDDLDPDVFHGVLQRFQVDAALLNHAGVHMRAGAFNPKEWALVYLGTAWRRHGAFVFAKRVPRHQETIARFEIPVRPRFRFSQGTWLEPLWQPPSTSPVPRCEWYRRLAQILERESTPRQVLAAEARALAAGCLGDDDEVRVRFMLGAARQLKGDLTGARRHYDRVLALRPEHVDALVNRGFARLGLGDPAGARRDLEEALRLEPGHEYARVGLARLGGDDPAGARLGEAGRTAPPEARTRPDAAAGGLSEADGAAPLGTGDRRPAPAEAGIRPDAAAGGLDDADGASSSGRFAVID